MSVSIATGRNTVLRRVRVIDLRMRLWGVWILVFEIVIHRQITLSIRPRGLVYLEVGGYRFWLRVR